MAVCAAGRCVFVAVRSVCAGQVCVSRVFSTSSQVLSPVCSAQRKLQRLQVCVSQRSLSAVALLGQYRPLCRYEPLDVGEEEENLRRALTCKHLRRFITDPHLAHLVTQHLSHDLQEANAVIFECNPGPGVLTRSLLNAGVQRLVALESDKAFLHDLQVLESKLDGQLEVVHCDFFKLDPMGQGSMKPPAMFSEKLFTDLGISEVAWTSDVPVKVVGIFSQRNERNMLWKLLYSLFERQSVFRYGRVELIMFISEKNYAKMVAPVGDYRSYQALSALFQMSCNITLLHKEPWSSFITTSKNGTMSIPKSSVVPNDHLCLVRVTPRVDLFSSGVTPYNSSALVMMVKQCLAKRRGSLSEKLNSWSSGGGLELLGQVGLSEEVKTGQVHPDEYKRLFELMDKSEHFAHSWLYSEILENTRNTGCRA